MVKTIKISGKNYNMKSSAFTQFAYKNMTGRSFLSDIQKLSGIENDTEKLDDLIEILLDVSYIMINENDKTQVQNKEEFIKGIDNLFEDTDWITEVIGLAIMPLSGGNTKEN